MLDGKKNSEEKIFTIEDENHKPHQLFCEMDELQPNLKEWKEAARWIKFEEDVENGGRWSKPHVATLSLHSLLELRNFLVNGVILLDIPGDDLSSIVDYMLDIVIKSKQLDSSKRDQVRNALLLEHVHPYEKKLMAMLEKKATNIDILHHNNSSSHNITPPMTQNHSSNLLSSKPVFDLSASMLSMQKANLKPKVFLLFNFLNLI